jgi:NlpC/P60 family.
MNRFRTVEATLNAELAKPYAYGTPEKSDCFMMGCALVDALEGTQIAGKYAGAYKTLAGAQRALRKRGFKSLIDFWTAELGRPSVSAAGARFGDLVILRLADGAEHVGVCLGTRFVTKTEKGREDHGLSDVVAAFHLG